MSYTYRAPADEARTLPSGTVVKRTRICLSNTVVYSAWEPMINGFAGHQTCTTIDGAWYGSIASRRDDTSYAHLSGGSDERIAAVRAYYNARYSEAHEAIVQAFPEADNGIRTMGEIEVNY